MTVEQRQANFRVLNPVTATTREIAEVLNRTINGGLNSVGYVTLSGTTTETTVLDDRYNVETLVFFTPVGHDPWHHNPYVKDTSTNGNIVIGHNNAGHDATFAYLLIG
jgi:polyphosphate kinase